MTHRPRPDSAPAPSAAVSVVMITRDRRSRTLESLEHLVSLPSRPHVIVVDNASSDGTAGAVGRDFPDVELIRLDQNLGAPARNIGVERATTPLVAFADDDSWWEPGSLELAADVFRSHPRLGALAARILVGPSRRLDPVCSEMARSPLPTPEGAAGPAVLGFVACGAIVRRSAFLEVGGFDDVVFFLGEEARVAMDLAEAGWQLAYCHDVIARHEPAAGQRDPHARRATTTRNDLLTQVMRRPWSVVARTALRTAVRATTDRAVGRGLWGAVRDAPMALSRRQLISPTVEGHLRLLGH